MCQDYSTGKKVLWANGIETTGLAKWGKKDPVSCITINLRWTITSERRYTNKTLKACQDFVVYNSKRQ